MHISENKHEYNVRRQDELEDSIKFNQHLLKEGKKMTRKQKRVIKREIKNLIRQKYLHGDEILQYEDRRRRDKRWLKN